MDRDELIALMDAETWLTAGEVVERGLAEDAKAAAASLSAEGLGIRSEVLEILKEISSKLSNGTFMR